MGRAGGWHRILRPVVRRVAVARACALPLAIGMSLAASACGSSAAEGGKDAGATRDGSGTLLDGDALLQGDAAGDGGAPGDADAMGDGGACPPSSPMSCVDCSGTPFCLWASCPQMTCGPQPVPPAFPLESSAASDGGAFVTVASQCAALAPRPLTAGSYTDPKTGLTIHWPTGWTLTTIGTNATFATVTAPVSWVPTGSTTSLAGEATFTLSVFGYSNADQAAQAVSGAVNAADHGADGMATPLAGHPGAVWWYLAPPPEPQCPAVCDSVPPSPDILTIAGLVQFTTIDAGAGFGVEVDLAGSARADAVPAQVFCDIEEMITGVTGH